MEELTSANFNAKTEKGLVLVDFNADWCGPCQIMKPTLEELSTELPDITFASVNIDSAPDLAEKYGVSSIPCLVLLKDGEELDRSIGVRPKSALKRFITKATK